MPKASSETPVKRVKSPTEIELQKLLKLTRNEGEGPSKFRARIVRAASKLDEAVWAKLSENTQKWVNAGVEALRASKPVPGFEPAQEESAAPKPKEKRKRGAGHFFRALMIDNPDWDKHKLLAQTVKAGYQLTRMSAEVVYYEARATLEALAEKGLLRNAKKLVSV